MQPLRVDWVAAARGLLRASEPVWGRGLSVTALRRLWVASLLQRFNEGLALDYVSPFRLLDRSGGP